MYADVDAEVIVMLVEAVLDATPLMEKAPSADQDTSVQSGICLGRTTGEWSKMKGYAEATSLFI